MDQNAPGPVTRLLREWRGGRLEALDEILPLVYDELRRLARRQLGGERPDHTLQTTALVHEAYLRLVGADVSWVDRAHFLSVAARSMRRILVDHARARRSAKRGSARASLTLEESLTVTDEALEDLEDLDDALRRLEAQDPRKGKAVEMHFFGGLTYDEIARVLEVSPATVRLDMRFAKAWLRRALGGGVDGP